MAVRAGMLDLIGRVRALTGDTDRQTSPTYSDQEIQDTLDRHAMLARQHTLSAVGSVDSGGTVRYREFVSEWPDWEGTAGLTFVNSLWANIGTVVSTEDPARGRWTFAGSATSPYDPMRPVMVTGAHYDVYGAAADLLDWWPTPTDGTDIDRKEGDTEYKYSQRADSRDKLIQRYRAMSWPTTTELVRNDG